MARKHSNHGPYEDLQHEDGETPAAVAPCWLCNRPTGKTIVWHHPVPKSRGGRDVVPMHPICQQTLIANFTNSELQRHAMDVDALLANPNVRKFVDWVAKKDLDFTAPLRKSSADRPAPSARSILRNPKTERHSRTRTSAKLEPGAVSLHRTARKRSSNPPEPERRRSK